MTTIEKPLDLKKVWDEAAALAVIGRLLQTYPTAGALPWYIELGEQGTLPSLGFITDDHDVLDAAKRMDAWLKVDLQENPDKALQALEYDFMRMFVGPGMPLASPWESIYRHSNKLLFQSSTILVRNWYHRYGLAFEREGNEPEDHLGLELGFLGVLASEAATTTDDVRRGQLRAASSLFWRQHPSRWIESWIGDVANRARHPFLQDLSILIRGLFEAMSRIHS